MTSNTMKGGKFITIEGGEGAGKSTVIAGLAQQLKDRGRPAVTTAEPGGTKMAEVIRRLVLQGGEEPPLPESELLLLFAARAQHLHHIIRPALDKGQWVLCDRFTDSTYAYQGAGRRLGEAPVAALEALVQKGLRPDLTLIMDVPVKKGLARIRSKAGHSDDHFEKAGEDFHERVRECFLQRAQQEPERCRLIAADQPPEQVLEAMWREVEGLL